MKRHALQLVLLAPVVAIAFAFTPPASAANLSRERLKLLADAQDTFDHANELSQSDPDAAVDAYRKSAELFRALIADGVKNGKLYYNLGNAYLQSGDLGRAILNYRRAEMLIGKDPQLQANLHYARSLRRTQIEPAAVNSVLHTMFFWHYNTSTRMRFFVALAAYVLFWLALTGRMFIHRVGLKAFAGAVLVIWLVAGASVGVDAVHNLTTREGVTTAADIVVRKGNGEAYEPQFKEDIHEGVEFVVEDERPGWYQIELPDGSTGWIRTDQAEII